MRCICGKIWLFLIFLYPSFKIWIPVSVLFLDNKKQNQFNWPFALKLPPTPKHNLPKYIHTHFLHINTKLSCNLAWVKPELLSLLDFTASCLGRPTGLFPAPPPQFPKTPLLGVIPSKTQYHIAFFSTYGASEIHALCHCDLGFTNGERGRIERERWVDDARRETITFTLSYWEVFVRHCAFW